MTSAPKATAAQVLDPASAIRRMQCTPAFYARLLATFLQEADSLPQRLRDCVPAALPALLHTFKGSAATVGADALAEAAAHAEGAARRGDPIASPQRALLVALDAASEAARTWLENHAQTGRGVPGATEAALLCLKLRELLALLERADARAAGVHAAIRHVHGTQLARHPGAADALDEAICKVDFAQAMTAGQHLLAELRC